MADDVTNAIDFNDIKQSVEESLGRTPEGWSGLVTTLFTEIKKHCDLKDATYPFVLQIKEKLGPNIVIFMVDDMGWGDPGVFGGGAAVGAATPIMDDLARQGMMLTSTYSQPSCTPTRASFQTGRLPQRSGTTRPTAAGEEAQATQELYLAKVLSDAGQLDNTFVFVTSDNGAEEDVMAGGIFTSDAGHHPWRGAKGTTWEGGVRVSGIASWPGMIKSGRSSDGLFDLMDLFLTSMRMAGVDKDVLPNDRYYDSIDQTDWLLTDADDENTSNREAVFYWYGQDFYGVRWQFMKRMERIMTVGTDAGPGSFGGLFNATKSETTDPSLGWYYNLYMDPKERIPTTRTWAIAPMVELSLRNKMTFLQYPQAPRGVLLGGYVLGGPAGGNVPEGFLEHLRAQAVGHSLVRD